MPASYPDWVRGVAPRTCETARPSATRYVADTTVIRVTGATYRDCEPIDGVFEVVDHRERWLKGKCRYEVYCAWFGVKPFTVFPRLVVNPQACELIESYTGEVIDDISA